MGKSYEIPIRISLAMEVTVEADSLEEAQQKALTYRLENHLVLGIPPMKVLWYQVKGGE